MRSVIRTFFVLFLGLVLAGCCDDCPICPEPESDYTPDYHLLFSWANPEFVWKTYILSSATNTYIDSTVWPHEPPDHYLYTPDGRYLIYSSISAHILCCTEVNGGDTVAVSDEWRGYISLSPNGTVLASGSTYDGFRLMHVPSLQLFYDDTLPACPTAFDQTRDVVYAASQCTAARLIVYDFENPVVERQCYQFSSLEGVSVFIDQIAPTKDGSRLLLGTSRGASASFLHVVDTDSFQIISEHSMPWPLSFITLHPDGKRAFLGYYGLWEVFNQGTIWEYDIENDVLTRYLDKDDIYAPEYSWPIVAPTDMVILPDGKRAYVVNGFNPYFKDSGPFIVINLETDRVIELIGLPPMSQLEHLVLNPVDWNKKGK